MPRIIGGRYGLSSKGVHAGHGSRRLRRTRQTGDEESFTVGIDDDVSHTSLSFDESFSTEADDVVRAVFFGLGSTAPWGPTKLDQDHR